jgi:hypothetical protein
LRVLAGPAVAPRATQKMPTMIAPQNRIMNPIIATIQPAPLPPCIDQ